MNRDRHAPIVSGPVAGCLPSPTEFDARPRARTFGEVVLRAVFGLIPLVAMSLLFWTGIK